ncbi:hypothetical protein DFH28DRAFT_908939, partial [Melampsora americana]
LVPYYEHISDLSNKTEGCLYRLLPRHSRDSEVWYNPYEDVPFLEDHVVYDTYQKVKVLPRGDLSEWVVWRIYIHLREAPDWYFLKFHVSWEDMKSQGRAHCFERAQSNRYAAMMLKSFQHCLYIKRKNSKGQVDLQYRQWYTDSLSMVLTGPHHDDQPRWMICEGVADPSSSHRYIYEYNFNNKPIEPQAWTDHIHAFVHYIYDISAGMTLIANLECDDHGKITNIVCFDQQNPPYHSCNDSDMAGRIDRAFNLHFPCQHKCNKICEHIGNVKMGSISGDDDWS